MTRTIAGGARSHLLRRLTKSLQATQGWPPFQLLGTGSGIQSAWTVSLACAPELKFVRPLHPFVRAAMSDIEGQLRDYLLNGVAADILRAERAYYLVEAIGRHADRINAANFGQLFGPLQEILSEHQTLAITKIFERHSNRNRVRTIPAVLRLLETHADKWSIPQRSVLHELLVSEGHSEQIISSWSGAMLTHAIVQHFRSSLPSSDKVEACAFLLPGTATAVARQGHCT